MKKLKVFLGLMIFSLFVGLPTIANASDLSDDSINPVSLVTGDEDLTSLQSEDITVPVDSKLLIVPVTMDYNGQLVIDFKGTTFTKSFNITLYSDEDCTTKVGYTQYIDMSSPSSTLKVKILEKGTYYLKIELGKYEENDVTISYTAYSLSSANKTLKAKKWIGSYSNDYKANIYHKITIDKPGLITVIGAPLGEGSTIYLTLSNSKKVDLSDQKSANRSNDYTTCFAVKKGTYYIKASSSNSFKLKYTFTAVEDASGSSQKKAVTIGKGKTMKGLIFAEDKTDKVDWYKVTLSKKQILSFSITAKSNDTLNFEIIPAAKNIILFGDSINFYDIKTDTIESKSDMPAGTYYIKVTKKKATTSGYYSIKLNK